MPTALRPITPADMPFVEEMLTTAANWRGGEVDSVARLADPHVRAYIEAWGRAGDRGFIAEDSEGPIGAAWTRLFSHTGMAWGIIDASTPVLSIGVATEHRGRGVGGPLLDAVMWGTRADGYTLLSLSVEPSNQAALGLYGSRRFEDSGLREDGSLILTRRVFAAMDAEDAVAIIELLERAKIEVWVGGGWGIDALARRQTRTHDDLDLAMATEDAARAITLLEDAGYRIVPTEDWRPVRFVMHGPTGLAIDIHPLRFRDDGSAVQASLDGDPFEYPADGFSRGKVAGKEVGCISAELQLAFHLGYAPREVDRVDMALLAEVFGLGLPPPYD